MLLWCSECPSSLSWWLQIWLDSVCFGKRWVFEVCQYLSLPIANSESDKKKKKQGKNYKCRGFLILTCVCSNALLKITAVCTVFMIFSNPARLPWGSVLRATIFSPSAWLCFCTCWVQSFSTCASNPGSIRATVHVRMSYCTSCGVCQHAAPGLQRRRWQKAIFAQPAF